MRVAAALSCNFQGFAMKALCWQGKHKISCETGVIGADDRAHRHETTEHAVGKSALAGGKPAASGYVLFESFEIGRVILLD